MENSVYSPLYDFDSIVDTAMSVAHLIREEYWSHKYFINLDDDRFLMCLFATMPTRDPMPHLMASMYTERCGGLYKELMDDPKLDDHIYTYATADVVHVLNATGYTKPTVLVKNDRQATIIQNLYKGSIKLLKSDGPVDLKGRFGAYYTDDVYNLRDRLISPEYLNLRVMRMKFNMESKQGFKMFKLDVVSNLSSTNSLASFESYAGLQLPEEQE